MNLLDLIVTVFLVYQAILGFGKGFIRILFDILALFGGVFIALKFYSVGDLLVTQAIGWEKPYSTYLSFLVLWGCAYMTFIFIGKLAEKFTTITLMGPMNRIGGAFFGGVKGFFYLLPILILLSHSEVSLYQDSRIAKPINSLVQQHLLSADKARAILRSLKLEPEKVEETMIKTDPGMEAIQGILEGDQTKRKELDAILEKME